MDTVGVCGHQKKKKSVGGAKEYMGMEVRIKNGTSSECCIYIAFGLHLSEILVEDGIMGNSLYSSSSSTLGCLFLAAEWREHSEFGPSGGKEKTS